MKRYEVCWSKAYYASGTVEIEAEDELDAERIVWENIGDYEGSMQYNPDDDNVECFGEIG